MLIGLADTHAAIWYLSNDPRLSSRARALFEAAATQADEIGVSAISLVERVGDQPGWDGVPGREGTHSCRGVEEFDTLTGELESPASVLVSVPLDRRIAEALTRIDRLQVPDMPDRIIAATALHLGIPLMSRDGKIRASVVTTIW